MRKMKKVVSLVAAAVMVFALAVPVNAAVAASDVAAIGDAGYASLQAAVDSAKDGDTIVLLNDITTTATVTTKEDITLDLNGKTITSTANAWVIKADGNSTLTVEDNSTNADGAIVGVKGISVVQGSKLVMNSGTVDVTGATGAGVQIYGSEATMNGGTIKAAYGSILIYSNNDVRGTFVMNGGTLDCASPAIYANGSDDWDDVDVTINDGDLISETAAIYWPAAGNLTINGGTLKGKTVAYVKSGSLTITDGTFVATGEQKDYAYTSSSFRLTGDALVIENVGTSGYQAVGDVSITGGNFTSKNAAAVASYAATEENSDAKVVTEFITGGTFSSDVKALAKTGYESVKQTDGTYIVCNHADTVTDKAVAATCTTVGYTEGSHCTYCNTVFKAQTEIPATGHTYVNGACACGDKIEVKVETEVVDTITKEEVKVEEVKEVTVVEDENTVKAEISVNAETTLIATEVVAADDVKETEAVKSGAITEETAEAVKEAVLAGDTVKTEIVVNEVKTELVPTSAQTNIEKAAATVGKNAEVVQYLDVEVVLKAASTGEELGTVNVLKTPIKVTVAIPENLKAENVKYVVIRDHNGVVTKLPTTVNANGTITFETDMFSTYALAVADADATAPKTGDTGMMSAAWVAIIAAAGIAFVAARRRSVVR